MTEPITVYLGLGSNLGHRRHHLQRAVVGLRQWVTLSAVSPVYETAAWGVEDQPDFLNLCVMGTTTLDPHTLLRCVKQLEVDLGREPTFRWGPRVIDIDILMMGAITVDTPTLTVPHPGMAERASVLVPLADIAASAEVPPSGQTIADLLQAIDQTGVRRLERPLFPTDSLTIE